MMKKLFLLMMPVKFPLFSQFTIESYGIQKVAGLPTNFIIPPEGKLVKILQGLQTMVSLEIGIQHAS